MIRKGDMLHYPLLLVWLSPVTKWPLVQLFIFALFFMQQIRRQIFTSWFVLSYAAIFY